MTEDEVAGTLKSLGDGQEIKVLTADGREFDGFYDAAKTTADMLAFDSLSGPALKARWANLQSVNARSPQGPSVFRPNPNLAHWNQPGYVSRRLKGE